jgi:ETFB lysine methyltransferase
VGRAGPVAGDDDDALEAGLRRRFRVVESRIAVGNDVIALLHPASADELISEADFVADERLPYWAEPWPSALVLAGRLSREEGARRTLLELGCGAGLVAAAAARAGFRVTATDYYDDALRFARVNAARSGGGAIATRMVDWRNMPADLGRYDLVVASDVLYERPYATLVAQAIARTLSPRGRALVADPGRTATPDFLEACTGEGLQVLERTRTPFVEGAIRQTIDVYEIGVAD